MDKVGIVWSWKGIAQVGGMLVLIEVRCNCQSLYSALVLLLYRRNASKYNSCRDSEDCVIARLVPFHIAFSTFHVSTFHISTFYSSYIFISISFPISPTGGTGHIE